MTDNSSSSSVSNASSDPFNCADDEEEPRSSMSNWISSADHEIPVNYSFKNRGEGACSSGRGTWKRKRGIGSRRGFVGGKRKISSWGVVDESIVVKQEVVEVDDDEDEMEEEEEREEEEENGTVFREMVYKVLKV